MKNLLKLNSKIVFSDYEASLVKGGKTFNLANYYPKKDFLHHCLALFATVPLIRNEDGLISMRKTVEAIPDTHIISNVGIISSSKLKDLILFTAHANRSALASVSATKDPTLGGLTPLFMYAHKLYDNVQYSEWCRRDDYIMTALGKFLASAWTPVCGFTVGEGKIVNGDKETIVKTYSVADVLIEKPVLDNDQVSDLRRELMTYKTGQKAGEQASVTTYKMPTKYSINGIMYPAAILIMELQTWIANAELRNEESMILDIWDWVNIPEPYDVVVEKPKPAPVDPGRSSLRDW